MAVEDGAEGGEWGGRARDVAEGGEEVGVEDEEVDDSEEDEGCGFGLLSLSEMR